MSEMADSIQVRYFEVENKVPSILRLVPICGSSLAGQPSAAAASYRLVLDEDNGWVRYQSEPITESKIIIDIIEDINRGVITHHSWKICQNSEKTKWLFCENYGYCWILERSSDDPTFHKLRIENDRLKSRIAELEAASICAKNAENDSKKSPPPSPEKTASAAATAAAADMTLYSNKSLFTINAAAMQKLVPIIEKITNSKSENWKIQFQAKTTTTNGGDFLPPMVWPSAQNVTCDSNCIWICEIAVSDEKFGVYFGDKECKVFYITDQKNSLSGIRTVEKYDSRFDSTNVESYLDMWAFGRRILLIDFYGTCYWGYHTIACNLCATGIMSHPISQHHLTALEIWKVK